MRILAAGDVHGVLPVYQWLVDQVISQAADALLLCGDLFGAEGGKSQRDQISGIETLLRRSPAPVLYIMGNDDEIELGLNDGHIQSIHGRCVEVDGFRFVGYQYTPPFFGVTFVKADKEIAKDMPGITRLLDSHTVLVTHAPARGILDEVRGEPVGSVALAGLLSERPVLAHVHGHIHECFGRSGRHFNVAAAGRRRAMLIELPSLAHTVL